MRIRWKGSGRCDGTDEAVATARNRLNEMRAFSGVAQHFAQAIDSFLECQFVVNECISRPNELAEILPCDDFLWMFQQCLQYLERLARELLPHAGLANLPGLQIHFEDPKLYHPGLAGDGCHWLTPSRILGSLSHLYLQEWNE